jgi:predicted MFS family arabinose efflux permease
MRRRNTAGIHPRRKIRALLQPHICLAAMTIVSALPLAILSSMLPRQLVLPVLCLAAVAGATLASFVAWQRRTIRDPRHIGAWDVAGALSFIGFAAAMLSEPEHVILLTESATTVARTE